MSVQSEINRISGAKTDIGAAIAEKGVTVPAGTKIDAMAPLIEAIQTGITLPTLANEGAAADLLSGKQLIDDEGNIVTGSMPSVTQATPSISVSSGGLITASATQEAGKVAAGTKSATKQLTVQAAQTITPGTSNKTIASGRYLTGTQTIKGDANLLAENIKSGVSIFGVAGSLEAGSGGGELDELITGHISVEISSYVDAIKSGAFWATKITGANFPSCRVVYDAAFSSCPSMLYANFPVCSDIRSRAFYNCRSLANASFPSCKKMGGSAFEMCVALKSIDMPYCSNVGSGAFSGCLSLATVNFPACETIGSSAFCVCASLESANFPVCVTIESSAFASCSSIVSVSFPMCTTIRASAFAQCYSLGYVEFPVCSTTGIGMFYKCSALEAASFPAIRSIYASTFYGCTKLISLYLLGTSVPYLVNTTAFSSTPMSESTLTGAFGSIFVRPSLLDAFKAATNWAKFSARITAYEGVIDE